MLCHPAWSSVLVLPVSLLFSPVIAHATPDEPAGQLVTSATPTLAEGRGDGPEPMFSTPALRVGRIDRIGPAGPLRGWWAMADLRDPTLRVVVTPPLEEAARADQPERTEARLTPTTTWAQRTLGERRLSTLVAVNANYFGGLPGPDGKTPSGWKADQPVDLLGLSVVDGVQVSAARRTRRGNTPRPDPALVIRRLGSSPGPTLIAEIGHLDPYASPPPTASVNPSLTDPITAAVAGVGPSDSASDPSPGTLLVQAGQNLGSSARVAPSVRHPRTAVGVSADQRTLILLVVDGRQPAWSVGLTLPDLADLMIQLGAADAINLDGGGSTTWVYLNNRGQRIVNRPSDGAFRPVGNSLGVGVARE